MCQAKLEALNDYNDAHVAYQAAFDAWIDARVPTNRNGRNGTEGLRAPHAVELALSAAEARLSAAKEALLRA